MEQKRVLRIVLASPGDVQAERDALPAVLDELNRGIAAERNLVLELHRWETDAYPGFHSEGPQGLIDPTLKIEDCDILIGIFWKRFGTPTHDAQSGTEHEILRAYEAWQQKRRPHIMVYFNQKAHSPKSKDETDQWGKVLDFQLRFPKEGLWASYKNKPQFERLVRTHLTNLIRIQYPRSIQSGAAMERPQQDAQGRTNDELAKEYLAGLASRVSTVYIFGEDEPRALDKVFVELSIVEEYRRPTVHAEFLGLMDAEMRQRRSSFARAEDEPRGPGDKGGKVKRTVKPDELLRGRTKAVVAGAPGCGKTTLLRYLAWRTHKAQERLPVFLELKAVTAAAFERAQHDLAELLFAEGVAGPLDLGAGERERFREFFMARLAAGEVAIFLDGLDEVSGTDFFPRLCESVGEFTRRAHRDNTLVISTRPYALQARLEGLKQMEIAPLNQRQIEEFFAHYYGDDPEAQRLLRTLRRRRPLRELLRVPFLLAVVTELYRQHQTVVEDRLELYRQLVWQLVVQLDREKHLDRRDFRIPDRTGALKLDFLKYLACERLLIDDVLTEAEGRDAARLVFTGDVILDKAKLFLKDAGHAACSPYDLASDVRATPLLREVGSDVYAFTHLTIQEYLAAFALSRRDDCETVFCRVYFNPTLAAMEVLPMTLGLVRKPDHLYAALEQLPESLTFINLRLSARSLAYVTNPDRQFLTRLTDRLLEFVNEDNLEEDIYWESVRSSFSGVVTQAAQFIAERLAAFLETGPEHLQDRVVEVLGEIGGVRAADALFGVLLKDEDTLVDEINFSLRSSAADALSKLGDERTLNVLLSLLKNKNPIETSWAAKALGQLGDKRAVAALLPLLKSFRTAHDAAVALSEIGGEGALKALLNVLLKSRPSEARVSAAFVLGRMGEERVVAALLKVLKDRDDNVRSRAALALGEIGDERALEALLPLLKDQNEMVSRDVAVALGRIGGERALDALLSALKDERSFVRWNAASALGQIGDVRAVSALLPLSTDENAYPRQCVAEALGRIGDERAVVALLRLAKDKDDFVRSAAISALRQISGPRASDALLSLLKEKDPSLREWAASALGLRGDKHAVAALRDQLLKDAIRSVRQRTAIALGRLGDERAVDALLPLLKDVDGDLRGNAADALEEMDGPALAVGLTRALSHEDEFVRRRAAQSVGYYAEDEQVLEKLGQLVAGDSSEEVRNAAAEARIRYERKLAYFR